MNDQTLKRKAIAWKLWLSAIAWWSLGSASVLAQSNPTGNSPTFNDISPGRFSDVRPVQRQFSTDLQGGSQDFFRRGDEGLYFLPTENSKPILKIDEEVKSDEIKAPQPESSPVERKE